MNDQGALGPPFDGIDQDFRVESGVSTDGFREQKELSMDLQDFKNSLTTGRLPASLSLHLQALWHDGSGDWERAHDLVNDLTDSVSARIHAYLHRKEGDLANAGYWYRRANADRPDIGLAQEWENLVEALLKKNS